MRSGPGRSCGQPGPLLSTLCLVLTCLFLQSGCATLRPSFEAPTVSVSSFRAVPGRGLVPDFEIGLHVVNPNAQPLSLRGVSYSVALEGRQLLTGVGNDLPEVPAYGEGDVSLTAVPDLLQSVAFFTDLLDRPRDRVRYELTARLDVGRLLPAIRITDSGEFTLPRTTAR